MKKVLLALLLIAGFQGFSQNYPMSNNNPVTTCAGVFTDSGGAAGAYGNSQTFIKTFTPATPGTAIRLEFTSFETEDGADILQVFDGPDVNAPMFGGYSGTNIPTVVLATGSNPSGAITFRWVSDGQTTAPGWTANISCQAPCQLIQSVLTSSNPAADPADGIIKVCSGTSVTFNGDGTFGTDGAGSTYVWDVEGEEFTGQNFSYTFNTPGAYRVNLKITDPNSCTNTNLINQVVQVAVPPTAQFVADVTEICNGNQLSVDVDIAPVPFIYECTPPVSGTTFLPDGSGASYTSTVVVDCFQANQHLTSGAQLMNVCLTMEHSYLGDLNIVLTSPSGQSVVLKAYPGSGGTWLGIPIDDDSNLNPGTGAQYCLSMSGTTTMVNGPTQNVMDPVLNMGGSQLIPGTYLPQGTFDSFIGTLLNGAWTITVTDNLGIDNGYIFSWSLEFNPALTPADLSFTNTIVAQGWVPDPAIVSTTGNTIVVSPDTAGIHCFDYFVTDNFGCTTTFTQCINVLDPLPLNDPEDLTECGGQNFDLTEVIAGVLGTQNPAAYSFQFHHTPLDAQYIADPIPNPTDYDGSNGEIIYVSIEDLLSGSNCIEVREFVLHESAQPEATVDPLPATICQNSPLSVTFTGSIGIAPYEFEFNINGGATMIANTLNSDVSVSVPLDTSAPGNQIITITKVTDSTGCFQDVNEQGSVSVLVLPESQIVLNSANPCAADVTFQGLNGTAPYQFTYVLGTDPAVTVSSDLTGSVTFTVPSGTTGTIPVTIINVSDANCSNVQNVTENITFGTLPEADLTSNVAGICQGNDPMTVTFTGSLGTAPYTFTYSVNNGAPQIMDVTSPGYPVYTVDTSVAGPVTIALLEVSDANCVNAQTDVLSLEVFSLPTAQATISVNQVCQDGNQPTVTFTADPSLGESPYTFNYTLNGGLVQGTTLPVGENVFQFVISTASTGTYDTELISVVDVNGCIQQINQTVSVTVVAPPIIPAFPALHVCDENNDGIGCFDLTSTIAAITGGNPNLTLTFHETMDDAQNQVNPISGTTYCNPNPQTQTIFVSLINSGAPDCGSQAALQLFVDPVPVPLANIPAYELCDYTLTGDAQEEFDLSTMDAIIANGQTGLTISYYASEDDATNEVSPIGPLYTSGNATVWVRLEYATGCFAVSSFDIIVNPLPSITPYGPVTLCSDGISNTASFPLSEYSPYISGGVPGTAVSYHLTQLEANTGDNPLPSPYVTDDTVIYVRLENVDTDCETTTTLTLQVEEGPAINASPTPLERCDPNNDGIEIFDLNLATADILGGIAPGLTISYHETADDAQNNVNAITGPYANIQAGGQPIYVRVTSDATGCPSFTTLLLIVKPTPEANEDADALQECDPDGDGQAFFDLASSIPNILNGLDATLHTVRFWPTEADALAGTNEIVGIDAYLSASTTIYVSVGNTDTECSDLVELELIVNPLPTVPFPVETITQCDTVTPDDQTEIFDLTMRIPAIVGAQTGMEVTFYRSEADALAHTNAITTPEAYANEQPAVQTIWITVTNVATTCESITTMDIRVEPLPSPILPALDDPRINLCDGNQDGIAEFNLDSLILDMQQGDANIQITFHPTQDDAENGVNPITSPYTNDDAFMDTIWIRAVNATTLCSRVESIILNVTPAPVLPTVAPGPLEACDTLGNVQDGLAMFDLTVYEAEILALQPVGGTSYTIEYYTSLAAAQDGLLPIINPAQYQGMSGEIWYRIEGSVNDCANIGSFLIQVNAPENLPVSIGQWSQCDSDPVGPAIATEPFDLTNLPAAVALPVLPAGSIVTFYPTQADFLAQTNAIAAADLTAYVNVTNAQTIYISVENAQGCTSHTTLTLKVLPLPTVVPLTDAQELRVCDTDATVGTEIFDLTQNEDFMAGNDPNLAFSYYLTPEDAEAATNPIADPTQHTASSGPVWVRIEKLPTLDVDAAYCYVIVEMQLSVDPLPQVATPADALTGCATAGSATAVFDLTSQNAQILVAPQDPADFTFTYYSDAAATMVINNFTSYTGTDLQNVYVVVGNAATDCESTIVMLTLDVQEEAVANQPANPLTICADQTSTDGTTHIFDLTALDAEILGTQDPVQFTIAYYANLADAQLNNNAIADPTNFDTATTTVYAVVTNSLSNVNAPCRSDIIAIDLTVEPLLQVAIAGSDILCVTYPSLSPIAPGTLLEITGIPDPTQYVYEWYLEGVALGINAPQYYAQAPGNYTADVMSLTPQGCTSQTAVHTLILSSPPVALNPAYTVTDAFQDTQTITINVQGVNLADYQYSLDGGALQSSPVFTNIGMGNHSVRVVGYCDEIIINDVFIIDYPHYFTPNGDGIHDTWNISWPTSQQSPQVFIFDRYGKLMKQIHAPGDGWDGTYNGHQMPSTDYWFKVIYSENGTEKEFKAHFAMKR